LFIYEAGAINAANGSNQIEGFGTRWLSYTKPGDTLIIGENSYSIALINDNNLLTLDSEFTGDSILLGRYRIESAPVIESLDAIRARVATEVDARAGATRLKFITVSPGQEATYIAKLDDAKAFVAAGYPEDASAFIWISAEAAATGATPTQVADLIIYTAGLWSQVGAAIEGARQAAKIAISAGNEAQIYAAQEAFKATMAIISEQSF
jgi:hypothetical protein